MSGTVSSHVFLTIYEDTPHEHIDTIINFLKVYEFS